MSFQNTTGNFSTNWNLLDNIKVKEYELTISYMVTCILAALAGAVNIMLNVFVLKCICRGSSRSNVTVSFLLNNAIADTVIGVFTIYHEIYNILLYENFQECIFRNACICGAVLGSMFIIMGLNLERYLQITQPLRYIYIIRPWVVKFYLMLAWTLVIGLSVAPHLMWIGFPPVHGICGFFVVLRRSYITAVCLIMFTIVGVQISLYIHIFFVAVSKIRQDRKRIGPSESKRTIQMWWKPAKVVLIIVGANAFTMIPVAIYMFMVTRGKFDDYTDKEKEILLTYIAAPCFVNSVLNPILYSFQIPEVKKDFRKTFCCFLKPKVNEPSSTAWTA